MTITEVAQKYDISTDTLRYYERIGLIPSVTRTKGGFRNYEETDRNWVQFIKCMRSAGVSIEALVEYVSLFQQGESTHEARKALLIEQLSVMDQRLAEIQECRNHLQWKIDHYDDKMKAYQKSLE